MLCQLSYRGGGRARARVKKAGPGRSSAKLTCEQKKRMLDGIRTRNPQIRSLVRYPLRHENLRPLAGDGVYFFPDSDDSKKKIDI